MNILITGGYGFIGSFIAERFFKEKHSIFIIDDLSSGEKKNVGFKHRFFNGDVTDKNCEIFFKSHSFDVVIHCAAQTGVLRSIESPYEDSSTNILGLINILNLSQKYGVKKFVFCSTAAVYGENTALPLKEEEQLNPISPYGINKMNGEMYCQKWGDLYGLSSLIFRFSNVYGPRQHISSDSGVISTFTTQVLKKESLVVYGTGEQTHDFIYVGDVAEAIYRSVISNLSGVYNLSSNTQTSLNELIAQLTSLYAPCSVEFQETNKGDISFSQLDNGRLKKDLDWVPKYTIQEGLQEVISYYEKEAFVEPAVEKKQRSVGLANQWLHLAENLFLFCLFFGFSFLAVPAISSIDLWMIYVLLSALLFGKTQAVLSSVLAIVVQVSGMMILGRDFASLFTDNALLATFTIYLLIGLIVSYVVDRRKIELLFTKDELVSLQEQYTFLSSVYEETLEIKNELQQQILRTEDGIGNIYQATRSLDSLEPEALFAGSIQVLERTLKAKHFAIYSIAPNGFARLAAKSGDPRFLPEASLKIKEDSLIGKAVADQKIGFNYSLSPSDPPFVSPIIQKNTVVAMIVCYDVSFGQLTLSYQNLVDVVSRLISASLERSSDYIQEINHERYVEETTALKPAYFQRIIEQKRKAEKTLHIPFTLLRIEGEEHPKQKLHSIASMLRTTDYFGFTEDEELFIILSNTEPNDALLVIERLDKKGIQAAVEEETKLYVS
ncbi:NAD-dependent epimerase/dehydratase family protein [Metabacillus fastidiosus]|uniref:NAD-dependent epimerase/dehydratase family protein n=1 Tax=Metabacillus fastidiosus TaxID=1458 RepID=UPI002E23007F|nr:NAD-dependent epimerase/dehydratase family protein [Metabacillus fastidiosus]MED4532371.1 NAD-dependent epimerase/dehydratase family protein [Metabacillus fastidiosus]